MPRYLKNKRRKRLGTAKFGGNRNNIEMVSSDENKQVRNEKKSSFKIIKGRKKATRIKRLIIAGILFVLMLILIFISILSPMGIGEMISNFSATFSLNNNLPVKLSSTETYNVAIRDNYFFLLTDKSISAISNNGKISFSDTHGFSNPVMCESETRCLLYEQSGRQIKVYNAKKLVFQYETPSEKNTILAADIARNGYFAVATKSENYTSMVSVFDEKGSLLYEWYCPKETINSVAVSSDGKRVAVSTIGVDAGFFNSNVHVFNFKSADPIFSKNYNGEFIYGINSVSRYSFCVVFQNKCDMILWDEYETFTFDTQYSVDSVKSNNSYTVICTSMENNDSFSKFSVYDNDLEHYYDYEFFGKVDDFAISGKNILILSGNKIFLINNKGMILKSAECDFGVVNVVPLSSSSCLAISHNNIVHIDLK